MSSNIEEGNRLIAEFMGMKLQVDRTPGFEYEWIPAQPHSNWCFESAPPFDRSWNWIMPVYHKCMEKTFESENIHKAFNEAFYDMLIFNDVETLHESCLNFIKYYNSITSKTDNNE